MHPYKLKYRIGKTSDISSLAAYLASDESEWVTGELIMCNGGVRTRNWKENLNVLNMNEDQQLETLQKATQMS